MGASNANQIEEKFIQKQTYFHIEESSVTKFHRVDILTFVHLVMSYSMDIEM